MTMIALNALRFGHEADPPMNARITGRGNDIDALAASIEAHGLIQALTVSDAAGQHYVVDGNRRFAALQLLASQGKIAADYPVRCDLDGGTGMEISLAANLMRVPMHEADTYVTFRDLAAGGLTEADIAARFGIEKKRVRRMLVLGALAPVVIDAWRAGKVDVEAVRAFTLAPDVETQERVYAELSPRGALQVSRIRNELGMSQDLRKELKIVGLDAYRAAGGAVVEDLFGEQHNIADPDLMRSLAETKLNDMVSALLEEGWSWAAREGDLPNNWHWNWRTLDPEDMGPTKDEAIRLKKLKKRIDSINPDTEADELPEEAEHAALSEAIRLRGYTDEIKANSGCVVTVGYTGDVGIKRGVVKPATKPEANVAVVGADGKEVAAGGEPVSISMALRSRLAEQLTAASQQALLSNPTVALAAMVASMTTSGHYGQPVSVAFNQHAEKSKDTFAEVFVRCCAMRDEELMNAFTVALAPMIDMRVVDGSFGTKSSVIALLDALNQAPPRAQSPLAAALLQHFDAKDYFASAPKAAVLNAIREAVSDAEASRLAGSAKKDLVAYALAKVTATGWLPPELRTASYSGPSMTESKAA